MPSRASIIVCPSASPELVGKERQRKMLVTSQSQRCLAGYIYSSTGFGESSAEQVFGGFCIIAEAGKVLAKNHDLFEPVRIQADIDIQNLWNMRLQKSAFSQLDPPQVESIDVGVLPLVEKPKRFYSRLPFLANKLEANFKRCEKIFSIQVAALVKRISSLKDKKIIVVFLVD